jgi:hypothetical protein
MKEEEKDVELDQKEGKKKRNQETCANPMPNHA